MQPAGNFSSLPGTQPLHSRNAISPTPARKRVSKLLLSVMALPRAGLRGLVGPGPSQGVAVTGQTWRALGT